MRRSGVQGGKDERGKEDLFNHIKPCKNVPLSEVKKTIKNWTNRVVFPRFNDNLNDHFKVYFSSTTHKQSCINYYT